MTADSTSRQERLINIVRCFPQRRIVVVGDSVADQFVYGAISRVSREAPVLILAHEHTETVPGGAANCAANLASLGANVSLVSVAGDDEPGRALVRKLEAAGVDCSGLIISTTLRTTTKVRILAGQLHSTRQQVIRIDYDGTQLDDPDLRAQLRQGVQEQTSAADAVIISDYNYGVASVDLSTFARDSAIAGKIPIFVDSRFSLSDFTGYTSATPNQAEVEQLLGKQFSNEVELESAGRELREKLGYRALLITRGSQGMMLVEEGLAPIHFEAVGAREPVDVTGAGDTVMAAYSLAIACGSSFQDAARIANHAGGLVVMKRGTASVTREELENSVLHSS